MITLNQLSLQRGSKILLEEASLRIHDGQRVGIIGENGSGKSTLFKLLEGKLIPDQGDCDIPSGWRIAHMKQEVTHSQRSALDYVLDGDTEYRRLQGLIEQRQTDAADGTALAKLYSELEVIDGYTAPARAEELLHGLGFQAQDSSRLVSDFSGGWRIRLNLAQALMCPADLLLLDEPTNHLDLDTTWWLEKRLQQFRGTMLIISHDRDFLDSTVDNIVHIGQQQLQHYKGNYSAFERQRSERLAQQQQMFEKQQEQIAHIEKFISRFKAKATKAKQAQSRIKALERLERIAPAHVDSPFHFEIPCADKTSQPLVQLTQATLGYDTKEILQQINVRIDAETRMGLLGPNGAGKSTLVKALLGELTPLNGQRSTGEHLAIGYFNQHQLESLDVNASPALHIQRISPKAREQEVRNFLGSFGFQGDRAFETIKHFSGGEKARLALSIVAWHKPNLLLLDEPTNHLDLEMREALTFALQAFAGAVVVISHDRHLLRNTVDDFILVADGKACEFDGDLEDYHNWLTQRAAGQEKPSSQNVSSNNTPPKSDKRQQRQAAAAIRQQLQPLRKKLQNAEKKMEKQQHELQQLELQMADSNLYESTQKDKLQALLKQQGDLRQALENTEEEWMLLGEEYEQLEAEMQNE